MAARAKRIDVLEERAVVAHRAYIDALRALERAEHVAVCDLCGDPNVKPHEKLEAVRLADREKERQRRVYRYLLSALGYVPRGGPSIGEIAFRCSDAAAEARDKALARANEPRTWDEQSTERPH